MEFSDLKVEPIKTLMATQRILLTHFGYAISFMGDEQGLTSGDGINTFDIKVFRHNLDTDSDIDFFKNALNPNIIDFKNVVFEMKSVPLNEIEDFFKAFVL